MKAHRDMIFFERELVPSEIFPQPWMFSFRDIDAHHNEIFEQIIAMAYGWA